MPYGQARIPIGQRREKVTIQEAVTTDDGMGGQTVLRWQSVAEPYAAVQALDERTKEALMAQQIMARHSYQVVMPYQSGISTKHRIIVRDTTMEIFTVTDDEGKRRRLFLYVGQVQTA